MRICRVLTSLLMGGVEVRLLQLLPKLRERGAVVEVCLTEEPGDMVEQFEAARIPVTLVRLPTRLDPIGLGRLAWFFRRRGFDLVHTHEYHANVPGTIAAWMAGVRGIIAQEHNINMHRKWRRALTARCLMPLRHRFLCVSEAVRRDVAHALQLPEVVFEVLPNGIELEREPMRSREAVRRAVGVAPEAVVVAHVARLHADKCQAEVLAVLPRVLAKVPGLRLWIIGSGDDRELRRLAATHGVTEAVMFLGRRDDVPDWLAAADVSILPSVREGFSNVVLESMRYGATVLLSDVGGAREQIRDGHEGILIPPGDFTVFAEQLIRLAQDAPLRRRLADQARQRVTAFSLDRLADATMTIYREVLANPVPLLSP